MKFALVSLLGNRAGCHYPELTVEQLNMKMVLAEELLEVADKIEPGWSQWRGMLLTELQAANPTND